MATMGGRSAFRVGTKLFATSPLKKAPVVAPSVCKGMCEVFCRDRDIIVDEFIKIDPDPSINIVREALTDVAVEKDILSAGKCSCTCDAR
jgi:hypothetical protein